MNAEREALPYRPCVGAVVFNHKGEVLVARRVDSGGDAWQLPQGGIDRGESLIEALRREMREEIGTDNFDIIAESHDWLVYDLPAELVGRAFKGRYRGQRQRWFAVRFLGRDSEIDVATTRHPEFDAWKWVSIEDVPGFAIHFKREVYGAIVDEFRPIALSIAQSSQSVSQK